VRSTQHCEAGVVAEPVGVVPGDDQQRAGGDGAEIRTFLIADVRGYPLFTQERGDEAAAKLAAKFASLAREAVEARGGAQVGDGHRTFRAACISG
jgi:class 3 adenylate cyclase